MEVCSEVPISKRARSTLEYENHALAHELMEALDISALRAYNLLHEMKLYLLLCMLHPGEELAVPPEIDKGLHPFFDTEEFKVFCKERLAGAIEHIPHEGPMSPGDRERTLERAHARYAKHFDQRLWSQGLPVCTCRYIPN